MSRFRQRLHAAFSDTSSPGSIRVREAINDVNIDPSEITSLVDLNAKGLWMVNGAGTMFDQPLNAARCRIDRSGYLVCNPQVSAIDFFGEYYTNIPTDYPTSVLASRILRSEIMIEYQMLGGVADDDLYFDIRAFSPTTGLLGAIDFMVQDTDAGPVFKLSEATIAPLPGGVGTAFVAERDAISNKIRISAQRVNANSKNFVCTWYDRTAGAIATATVNWAVPGCGDLPLMWYFIAQPSGALPNSNMFVIKSLQISDSAIAYGAMPV